MLVNTRHPPLPLCGAYEGGQPVYKKASLRWPLTILCLAGGSSAAGCISLRLAYYLCLWQ
jgi:hypothetical protein